MRSWGPAVASPVTTEDEWPWGVCHAGRTVTATQQGPSFRQEALQVCGRREQGRDRLITITFIIIIVLIGNLRAYCLTGCAQHAGILYYEKGVSLF